MINIPKRNSGVLRRNSGVHSVFSGKLSTLVGKDFKIIRENFEIIEKVPRKILGQFEILEFLLQLLKITHREKIWENGLALIVASFRQCRVLR
jgi:hypothetical protein